jgi:hypothetical protein
MRFASIRCHDGFGVIPSINVTEQLESSSGRVEFRRRVVAATARQPRLPRIAWNRQRAGRIQCGKQQNHDRNCRELSSKSARRRQWYPESHRMSGQLTWRQQPAARTSKHSANRENLSRLTPDKSFRVSQRPPLNYGGNDGGSSDFGTYEARIPKLLLRRDREDWLVTAPPAVIRSVFSFCTRVRMSSALCHCRLRSQRIPNRTRSSRP